MSAKQDIYRNASTLTAKKQVPRRTSTTVPATSASLSSAAHPSAGCATLSASCCPNRLRMELPNEACITCAHANATPARVFACYHIQSCNQP